MLVQLQYIRAIAALLVVYFHATLQLQKVNPGTSLGTYPFGESGVDLFFVLSGFMMWLTTQGKPISTTAFYWRRIRRIVPLYWAATIFAATVAFFTPHLLKSTVFDLQHIIASLFFLPRINPADPAGEMIVPIIVPGWTLNYEMYFYFIFGLCLLLPGKFRLAGLLTLITGVFALCNLLPKTTATLFYGHQIIFEFVAGVLLGRLYTSGFRMPSMSIVPLLIAGFGIMLYNDYLGAHVSRLFRIGIPATLIVLAAISVTLQDRPTWRWLRILGDASYSIYLTHAFTLAGMRMIYPYLPNVLSGDFIFLAIMLGLSTALGIMSYYLFEVPVANALAKVRMKPRETEPNSRQAGKTGGSSDKFVTRFGGHDHMGTKR